MYAITTVITQRRYEASYLLKLLYLIATKISCSLHQKKWTVKKDRGNNGFFSHDPDKIAQFLCPALFYFILHLF
jgi:hypothetical protein